MRPIGQIEALTQQLINKEIQVSQWLRETSRFVQSAYTGDHLEQRLHALRELARRVVRGSLMPSLTMVERL